MQLPLVSIIIPSFNQGKFIRETIQSCLTQDYRPIEILVLDGCSTDETIDVLRSFDDTSELQWWSEPDDGVTDAVNKGLSHACGDILTIQSSDDIFLPGVLSSIVEVFSHHPDVGLVYGDVKHIDKNSDITGEDIQCKFDLSEYFGRFMYIPQPGTCFTRAAMQKAGCWRKDVSYVADADFWFRIVTEFPALKINKFIGGYRYHPEQRDTQMNRIAQDWELSIRDFISSGKLNSHQKRYARMGIYLARYRYCPEGAWIQRTIELYRAMLANPIAVFDKRFPKRELLPGRTPVWKYLSLMKRAMGFKPRSSK